MLVSIREAAMGNGARVRLPRLDYLYFKFRIDPMRERNR